MVSGLALACVIGLMAKPARADDPPAWTSLYYAVQNGDVAEVKSCLKPAAKLINHKNGELLQGALGLLADPQIIGLLLKAGANPNLAQANTGFNGLHIVLKEYSDGTAKTAFALLKLLLAAGCDANKASTVEGYTPLHMAARNEVVGQDVFTALLSAKKVDVNLRCKSINEFQDGAWPALFYVLERANDPTSSNLAIVKMLIAKGADLKATSSDKPPTERRSWTALHFAANAKGDRADIVTVLLAAGLAVDQPDTSNNLTPLHIALNADNPRVCQLLLEKGADYRSKDREGASIIGNAKGWASDKQLQSAAVIIQWAAAHP